MKMGKAEEEEATEAQYDDTCGRGTDGGSSLFEIIKKGIRKLVLVLPNNESQNWRAVAANNAYKKIRHFLPPTRGSKKTCGV